MDLLVNVDVDDLARAVAFYTQAFGLRVGRRFGGAAAELLGASSPIYLLENRAGSAPYPGAATPREYGRHWTPVHLDVAVPALEPALARAEAAGARREGDVAERPWGRMARLADPFGHGICLLEFRGRGYDEIADPS
ncbi:Glyoxalase/bleomycin resistance protein/dioxygenase [Anaeromyxobacter dehalogenans 2CP-1]|uniref:Glyoxalase/bleomycin resistance protein/dioxygenase n=1 Tax=Anaeromyxobacter dehalogenans (strain ATCC BAA-258 / DSM 21875 / 2CP-1) TaxID=455488 RepID=B8JFE4_ANAD2|nr:VOC family protein [Anaeromyxobacter dehalogenans]ACL66321.1 Glyoxalase/bleomycin resistance protein/dioxygenase [Anaeromyxobacter dehalogenans 2CP-1]